MSPIVKIYPVALTKDGNLCSLLSALSLAYNVLMFLIVLSLQIK